MSATTGKQLNKLFENIYNLFQESVMSSTHLMDEQDTQDTIITFMDSVNIKSEWEMSENEREGFGKVYFETGYHDSDVVYYPFEDTNDIGIFKFSNLEDIWEKVLECVIEKCDDDEHVNLATELLNQLGKIHKNLFV